MLDLLKLLLYLCRPARILRWGLFLCGMMVLWYFMERSTLDELFKARDRRNNYHDQVERLQQQQQRYQKELADLKAGGFSLEKAVREQCPLLKPGEKVLFIEDPPIPGETVRPAAPPLAAEAAPAASAVGTSADAKSGPAGAEPTAVGAEGTNPTGAAKAGAKKSAKNETSTKSSAKTGAGSAKTAKKSATKKTSRDTIEN